MLQSQHDKQQADVKRSLDRLKIFSQQKQLSESIPAFYYTAQILNKYAQSIGVSQVDERYFAQFKKMLQNFVAKDFSHIKKHEKEIVNDIFNIVDSQMFVQCLQPKIRNSRSQSIYQDFLKQEQIAPDDNSNLNLSNSLMKPHLQESIQKNGSKMSKSDKKTNASEGVEGGQQIWQDLLNAYKQHRIDQAYQLKNLYIEKKYKILDSRQQLFETIQLEYNTMIEFYKQFDLEGWVFDKEQNGVRLQYKLFEQQKQIAIRIQSQFNVSVDHFLAILSQTDLLGNYVPFCYDSKQLKVISRNQKIGTSKVYIPCLTDRQTYFYAAGYDRFKSNGSVFLFSKTINQDKLYQQKYGYKVPKQSDYVRLQYKFFIVEYIPITKQRAKVRLASKVDMKLNYLPQFILSMSARKFAFDYFKNIIKVNKKFKGSQWEKKMKQNPGFYNFFKQKIQSYLGKRE